MSEAAVEFEETLSLYESEIEEYRIKQGSSCKLPEKINPASPEQLSILLYDIMKLPPVSKKKPRGTGEEILEQFDNPLVTALLKFRKASKLVSTYVDKFPKIINAKQGGFMRDLINLEQLQVVSRVMTPICKTFPVMQKTYEKCSRLVTAM